MLAVFLEARFIAEQDMHDVYVAAINTARSESALAGTRIAKHVCPHDESPPGLCAVLEETVI